MIVAGGGACSRLQDPGLAMCAEQDSRISATEHHGSENVASERRTILLLDRQPSLARSLEIILDDASITVLTSTDWICAKNHLTARAVRLVICDLDLPGNATGRLLLALREENPASLANVVLSRNEFSSAENDPLGRRLDRDVLWKPFRHEQVLTVVLRRLGVAAPRLAHG